MKLYINEDNEILLEYSDVDFEAVNKKLTDKDFNRESYDRCREYYDFIKSSPCSWGTTLRPKLKQMLYQPSGYDTQYAQTYGILRCLERLNYFVRNFNYIELGAGFTEYIEEIRQRTEKLYQIERAKEAERERQQQWNRVCKNGCGQCLNKCRDGDDYFCRASGDLLPKKNVPQYAGRVYQLFNFIPFPTDNCPLNIDKKEQIVT